ncbi:hypothetical protein THASP1DRAFT_27864 [Thamnocephalis sphaerospora]|uniref:Calpain catalytic domain-containing protein n=1 Tax=Thamnocephalis sphaerospora TaxID=78915 RepID=A0A4P9XVN9_9FUNG|nr:hypothetical protein THASP1DRAFT_27864 [Thamnocephalis sphaerospora]|eukprot:RKP10346.1 hypothetical protein THASP1DRAFT_27864 [Thamnocephalis sphaerospora]
MADTTPPSPSNSSVHSGRQPVLRGGHLLTAEERRVLTKTSRINGKIHLPWVDADLQERFDYVDPFVDPDGELRLSRRQRERFYGWMRPARCMRHPEMIKHISSHTIVQHVVTNCSFVASLCVCADYERRFRKPLVTRCIYPQDKHGRPYRSTSGKYMIKLLINGIDRKIGILPVAQDGTLLTITTKDLDELWPILIEKAYLKVQGGYDFPGSNSGIDMHALTGWIPEDIWVRDTSFGMDAAWERLLNGLEEGEALATVATGKVDEVDREWLGLVPEHAYAVLRAIVVPGEGPDGSNLRLLRCKNPWSQHRWEGAYGPDEQARWIASLRYKVQMLDGDGYHQEGDGEFYIDWSSVCQYFEAVHLSWSPERFAHRYTLHAEWPLDSNTATSLRHSLTWCPQYGLKVHAAEDTSASVWLLLSRHITQGALQDQEYMTMHVYAGTDGGRMFYPTEPTYKGVYVNNPHVLIRLSPPAGNSTYTVVLTQEGQHASIYYTLRVYATVPFSFREAPGFATTCQASNWTEKTAGGNATYGSWIENPQYVLTVPVQTHVHMMLSIDHSPASASGKAARSAGRTFSDDAQTALATPVVAARLDLFAGQDRAESMNMSRLVAHSGDYRQQFTYFACDLDVGQYVLAVSTYEPKTAGSYTLTAAADVTGVELKKLPAEGQGMQSTRIQGAWVRQMSAMGNTEQPGYADNPHCVFWVDKDVRICARLCASGAEQHLDTNITIFARLHDGSIGDEIVSSGYYAHTPQGVATAPVELCPYEPGYVVVFSTWSPGETADFTATLYADQPLIIEPGGTSVHVETTEPPCQ